MSMTSGEMTPADIFAVTCGGRRDRDDGLFGGDGIVGLIALIIISGMFGFGGFGFGGGGMGGIFPWLLMSGGFNGFGGYGGNAAVQGALTRGELCQDMNFQSLENAVRGVQNGVCDGFYAMQNSVNNVGTIAMNGFSQAELSRCNQQAALMEQLYQMGYNQKDCCCQTQRAIEGANYDAAIRGGETNRLIERGFCDSNYAQATNTTAIIQNAHNDTDRVLAKLDAIENARKDETIADLRSKLAACGDQTTAQYIINQLTGIISPRAVPAYPAASPCGLGNWSNQVLANSQWNNGCGCNSGCCGCNG